MPLTIYTPGAALARVLVGASTISSGLPHPPAAPISLLSSLTHRLHKSIGNSISHYMQLPIASQEMHGWTKKQIKAIHA